MTSKIEANKNAKKRKKRRGIVICTRVDEMFWAAGEVRRGKLSGDLGGDNFTAGVYGVMV